MAKRPRHGGRQRVQTISTSFEMPDVVWRRLTALSKKYCVSKSAIVSMAIVRFDELELALTKISLAPLKLRRTKLELPEENHGNGHPDLPR